VREYLQEISAFLTRWFKHLIRQPISLAFVLVQPILWLLLFSNLFANVTRGSAFGADYRTFMTAGVIVMTGLGNSLMAGVPILFDKELGFLNKMLVAPISRSSIFLSRFIFVTAVTVAQMFVILLVAHLMGVRVAAGFVGVLGLLVIGSLLAMGIVIISLCLAFVLKGHADFFAIVGFLNLPLVFLSSALVPLELMPEWMRVAARFNPMTYAIDAMRMLIITGWSWNSIMKQVIGLLVFDVICLLWGIRIFRRHIG